MAAQDAPTARPAPVFRRLGQVPALDGLRGVAVLLVLVSHTPLLTKPGFMGVTVIDHFARGAFLGVDIFFVLSGFLITALLLREQHDRGGVGFWSFYQRRALRLLPALFALIAAYAVYAAITDLPADPVVKSLGAAMLYVSNWLLVWDFFATARGLGHLWSLAIEEQFYLLWPAVLIVFLGLRRKAGVVVAVIVALVLVVMWRRIVVWESGAVWVLPFTRTDTRADSLLIGALLASLWVRGRTPSRGLVPAAWIATGVLVVIVSMSRRVGSFLYLGGFTLFAIAVAVVILATLESAWPVNRVLSWGPLRLVGRVSYGLYLWHLPIFDAVERYGSSWRAPVRVIVAYGLTAVFTTMSWMLIERPALRLKHRLDARQAEPIEAS